MDKNQAIARNFHGLQETTYYFLFEDAAAGQTGTTSSVLLRGGAQGPEIMSHRVKPSVEHLITH